MKISVLASGSRGNSSLIVTDKVKILVDLGTTCLYVEKRLKELEISPLEINAIFLTHTHIDHIAGIKVFVKKYNPKIYLSEKMHNEIKSKLEITNYEYIEEETMLYNLHIEALKVSHDVSDCHSYIFTKEKKSVALITDTGYIHKKHFEKLRNKNAYLMESNHDVKMLMEGKYPHHLKHRVVGDVGHLSNVDSAYYLSKLIGEDTKKIVLIHLSKDNNTKELAFNTLKDTFNKNNIMFNDIEISNQDEKTELVML